MGLDLWPRGVSQSQWRGGGVTLQSFCSTLCRQRHSTYHDATDVSDQHVEPADGEEYEFKTQLNRKSQDLSNAWLFKREVNSQCDSEKDIRIWIIRNKSAKDPG